MGSVNNDLVSAEADAILTALFSPDSPADPYPLYDTLRQVAPVYRSGLGMTVLTRYDDCAMVMRSPQFRMVGGDAARADPRFETSAFLQSFVDWMVVVDPPLHTRLRRPLQRVLTPRMVEGLRPKIQGLVDTLLHGAGEDVDLVEDFARVLPGQVICELAGVPSADKHLLFGWTDHLARATTTPGAGDDILDAADRATEEFNAYLSRLTAERRQSPGEDLISRLLAAGEQEDPPLSDERLAGTIVQLLAAGVGTTADFLGSSVFTVLTNPEQLALLRGNPALVSGAVDELLRLEAPVQMTFARVSLDDTIVGGHRVARGEVLAPMLAAANRDPDVFTDAHELRIDRRPDKPALSFGGGIHHCLGAALARLESEVALSTLALEYPQLRIDEAGPSWRPGFAMRGLQRLRVHLGQRGKR